MKIVHANLEDFLRDLEIYNAITETNAEKNSKKTRAVRFIRVINAKYKRQENVKKGTQYLVSRLIQNLKIKSSIYPGSSGIITNRKQIM